jgi:hypothetical protein
MVDKPTIKNKPKLTDAQRHARVKKLRETGASDDRRDLSAHSRRSRNAASTLSDFCATLRAPAARRVVGV